MESTNFEQIQCCQTQVSTKPGGMNSRIQGLHPNPTDTWARLTYSFSTVAIPANRFGSVRNPYFEVSISSVQEAGPNTIDRFVSATNSMNGLGRGAFDNSGTTQCYVLYLNIKGHKDIVFFGISVSDAGDTSVISTLCADFTFF